MVKHESTTKQVHSAVNEGWLHGGGFVSSILAGTLIGYLLDQWWGTEPWLVITGVLLGSYSGFAHMWQYTKKLNESDLER